MKLFLTIMGLLNGAYMFIDGLFVVVNGKYIGPEKPGPWAFLFNRLNVNVFKLGPMFIVYGILWFAYIYGLQTSQAWAYMFGMILFTATLWYLPFGTLISLVSIVLLLLHKRKLGL